MEKLNVSKLKQDIPDFDDVGFEYAIYNNIYRPFSKYSTRDHYNYSIWRQRYRVIWK